MSGKRKNDRKKGRKKCFLHAMLCVCCECDRPNLKYRRFFTIHKKFGMSQQYLQVLHISVTAISWLSQFQ